MEFWIERQLSILQLCKPMKALPKVPQTEMPLQTAPNLYQRDQSSGLFFSEESFGKARMLMLGSSGRT